MKDIGEITTLVVDYGTFPELAVCLSKKVKESLYYSPHEDEYKNIKRCCIGDGVDGVTRCNDFMDPDVLKRIDLFCFPDIGYGGLQKYLKSIGKAVWGSMGADELELLRTRFLKVIERVGLPVAESTVIKGIPELNKYLREHRDQWIKINTYRDNTETTFHNDYEHSKAWIAHLLSEFGGLDDQPIFIAQKPIDDALEIGYDGFCVDGRFPKQSYQGYEKKNELYLGSLLDNKELPDEVIEVNDAMSKVLEKYSYRNFWATELRVKDGTPFFIDPTPRQAGQTMEHQYLSCSNLPEVIWKGANGELIEQEFIAPFAAEATIVHKNIPDSWKMITVPEEARSHVMLYRFCEHNDAFHFPPAKNSEIGVVVGLGDSVQEAIDDLKQYYELIKDEPISINVSGFAELVDQVEQAQKQGLNFGDTRLPSTEDIMQPL